MDRFQFAVPRTTTAAGSSNPRNHPTTGPGSTSSLRTKTTTVTKTLVESVDEHSIVAIVEGRGQARGEIGIACLNLKFSNLILCQFSDTQTYHRAIAKLNIFRPHKILMPATCCESTGTASQLYLQLRSEVSNVEIVPVVRKAFSEGKGLQRVKQLVVENFMSVIQSVTQKYYCLASAAALLTYVEQNNAVFFSPKSMKIEFQGSANSCMIDSKTAQHLELLQNNHQPHSLYSLLGILSNCKTPGGSRLLRMNLLQPPCDVALINERLDCVQELMETREVLCGLQDVLGRIPIDIEHIISTLVQIPKVDNVRITEQRINFMIALKHTLELLPVFATALENTQQDFFQRIRVALATPIFESILEKIKRVINEEVQVQRGLINMRRQRCFAVKPEVNGILDIARKAYCEIIEDMNKYIVELCNLHNMQFRLMENMKRGFYLQLILRRGEPIPQLPITFLQVHRCKNVINFTTQFLLSCDHRCKDVLKEIEGLSAIVVSNLLVEVRGDISSLYTVSEAIAQLDIVYALASYSLTTTRCARPSFSKLQTAITNGRHPVLEMLRSEPVVPNNTFLSEDVNFALITGPNMSGKTTYLKQIATLQILAQLGSFVPADSATFRISSNIFSRLGTGDSLEDNASSFAVEMTEMNYILTNINDNSLVIIDELGRGTSIEEGTAISWAMAEKMLKTKSFILFATHYLFLTKLENLYPNVLNFTMETQEWKLKDVTDDDQTVASDNPLKNSKLKKTHVVKRGVTKVEHYGLKLASTTSFPAHVVKNALSIAEKIIRDRKQTNKTENPNANEQAKSKALYLLGSHLKIAAAESFDTVPLDDLKEYLSTLKHEFLTTFEPGSLHCYIETNDTSFNDSNAMDEDCNSDDSEISMGESGRLSTESCLSQSSATAATITTNNVDEQ